MWNVGIVCLLGVVQWKMIILCLGYVCNVSELLWIVIEWVWF